jgi:DNA-binding transcriptional LysR family regulator
VTLAEELHFGRAAQRLFIAQQALSKQIKVLEAEVGVVLLRRTTREVELTAAGAEFLEVCRDVLARLDAGALDVQAIGTGHRGVLRVGFFVAAALELTTPILNDHRDRCPAVELELREYNFLDPSAGLADGGSDVAFVRLPVGGVRIEYEPLFTEARVAALSSSHPLAARGSVTVADLLPLRMTTSRYAEHAYREFWTLGSHRCEPLEPPIETSSHMEELEIVATGRAFSTTTVAAARFTPHAGVRFVPIEDVPRVTCGLAWRYGDLSPLAAAFVETARQTRDREQAIVHAIENALP